MPELVSDDPLTVEISKEFERYQRQKANAHGGVEPMTLVGMFHAEGEHQVYHANGEIHSPARDDNKVNTPFNFVGDRKRKWVGRINAINPVYRAQPDKRTPKALANAQTVDALCRALDEKVDMPTKRWELLDWLAVGGTAFLYARWVDDLVEEPMPVRFLDLDDDELGLLAAPPQSEAELIFVVRTPGGERLVPESARQALIDQGFAAPEFFELKQKKRKVGDVVLDVHGPLTVFLDHANKSIKELMPGQRVHVGSVRTKEWIEKNYGDTTQVDLDDLERRPIKLVTTKINQLGSATTGMDINSALPAVQGSLSDDDPDMFVVLEAYRTDGQYVVYIPNQGILLEDDSPYDDGIPIVDVHADTVKNTFWTKNYVGDIIPPNQYFDKRMQQLAEHMNANLKSPRLCGPGIDPSEIPSDVDGYVENGLDAAGNPMIRHMDPPQVAGWVMNTIQLAIQGLQEVSGGLDVTSQSNFPGQMRGSLGFPAIQEIIDTEWGPLYRHVAQRIGQAKQKMVNRVRQFYPPVRTMHYTGPEGETEVLEFHKSEILEAGVDYRITLQPGPIAPELRAIREERVARRLQSPLGVLYRDDRTGEIDKSKVAADVEFGDFGRESRESAARKLATTLIDRLKHGERVPQPAPFFQVRPMIDEFEAHMHTDEYIDADPKVQAAIFGYWQALQEALNERVQQAQQGQIDQDLQGVIRQTAQQVAARTGNAIADMFLEQFQGQFGGQGAGGGRPNPSQQLVQQLVQQEGQEPQ